MSSITTPDVKTIAIETATIQNPDSEQTIVVQTVKKSDMASDVEQKRPATNSTKSREEETNPKTNSLAKSTKNSQNEKNDEFALTAVDINKVFPKVKNLVEDLNNVFGKKQKSLKLFNRLISKTPEDNIEQKNKFCELFRVFCTSNRDAILEQKDQKLVQTEIKYPSQNTDIKINFRDILRNCDNLEKKQIWSHLSVIYAFWDQSSDAIDAIKKSLSQDTPESNFMTNIMSQVEGLIDENTSDPMAAMMGLLQSGKLNQIIGSLTQSLGNSDSGLDLSKMGGLLQTVMSSFQSQVEPASLPKPE